MSTYIIIYNLQHIITSYNILQYNIVLYNPEINAFLILILTISSLTVYTILIL